MIAPRAAEAVGLFRARQGRDRRGTHRGGFARGHGELRAAGAEIFAEGFCHRAALRAAGERGGGHRAGGVAESFQKLATFRGEAPFEHWLMRLTVRT